MHSPNPRASWASGDDNAGFYLILLVAGLCVIGVLLWINFHGAISAVVMALRHQEIAAIRPFTDRFDLADRQMMAADPESVSLRDLHGISHAVGGFFRIPAAILTLALAAVCTVWAAPSRYCRTFDLDGLIREQAASFPTTAAFVGRSLRLVPPASKVRPTDYALTPEEWIARFATSDHGGFDERAARRALIRQLGPPWRGVDHATPLERCLFAAFALHLAERRSEALGLLGRVSAGLATHDKAPAEVDDPLPFPAALACEADALRHEYALLTPALAIMRNYAFTHTALMALLNEARQRAGVLAPGQFAWLKLVDRTLWYALHSLGFETEGVGRTLHPNPRVEAIGARDHWAVERIAGEPLIEPALDRALDALRASAALQATRAATLAAERPPARG